MRIAVEEAVAEDHVQEGPHGPARNLLGVEAARQQRRAVVDLDALDEFHAEHAAACGGPVDGGHPHPGRDLGVGGEVPGHLLGGAPFPLVVHFAEDRVADLPVDRAQIGHGEKVEQPEREARRHQIDRDGTFHARIEHLQRDLAAVGQPGRVHLSEAGGRDRLALEAREVAVEGRTQLVHDLRFDLGDGCGLTRSWSRASSSLTSRGNTSTRKLAICPILISPPLKRTATADEALCEADLRLHQGGAVPASSLR